MPEGIDLGVSGLASGFDWRGLVDQLIEVERAPQRRMFTEQQAILARKVAYDSVNTQLSVLQNRVDDLNDSTLFESRLGNSSDEDVATVTAEAGAAIGSYKFDINQLATTAVQRGTSNIGSPLSTGNRSPSPPRTRCRACSTRSAPLLPATSWGPIIPSQMASLSRAARPMSCLAARRTLPISFRSLDFQTTELPLSPALQPWARQSFQALFRRRILARRSMMGAAWACSKSTASRSPLMTARTPSPTSSPASMIPPQESPRVTTRSMIGSSSRTR